MDVDDSSQQISHEVLTDTYALPGERSIADVRRRIAHALAAAEAPAQQAAWEARFLQAQRAGFIPAGRIAAHAGTGSKGTMINCFVQPLADSIRHAESGIPGIYIALAETAETLRLGGGVGIDFSPIRPQGAGVSGVGGVAAGPIAFMRLFDASCDVLGSMATLLGLLVAATVLSAQPVAAPTDLAAAYVREVDRRLQVPPPERADYALQTMRALSAAGAELGRDQLVVVVDRNAWVQAAMVWWLPIEGSAVLIGASPASTGRPSGFEHFETPTGVFEHTLDNPDFRAEGTRNALGIRGYGDKGMRVYDFGWVLAKRAWAPGEQAMRLQLHATDRDKLEPRLGERASKGCIRIPAAMNRFIDHHGVLDAAYETALAQGRTFWVLRPDREPTPWSGRYLVVIDSGRSTRPPWAVPPRPSAALLAAWPSGAC